MRDRPPRKPPPGRPAPLIDLSTGRPSDDCLRCSFVESISAIVATLDTRGRLTFLNSPAERLLGVSAARALGRPAWRFLADGVQEARRVRDALRAEGRLRNLETLAVRENGTLLPVALSLSYLRDGEGEVTGAVAICLDRSKEVRLRDELRAREQRLGDIVATTADAVICFDMEGRTLSWNQGAEEIYGFTEDEALGRHAASFLPPELEAAGERRFLEETLRARGSVRSHETLHVTKDGRRVRVLVTLTPLRDASGRRIGTSVVAKDITELTRLQEELIRTERLAAVGELAASIAHEVKNPLAAIRAAVEILGDRFPVHDSGREVVGEVIGQIERLDRTVKDLLTFARPSPLEKQPTKVPDLVGSALELLREEPLRKGIEVYLQLDPDNPGVPVDRRQVEQVFLNVILNALQAMEGTGRLTISARMEPDDVLVSFRDTGPGVPQEIMERVFHPFFTTKHRGTGLGLSIVQKVMEAHGGSIVIENHEERGAVVTLRLPMEARP